MVFLDYRLPHPSLADFVKKYQIIGFEFGQEVSVLPAKAYWPRPENYLTFYPKDLELVEYPDGRVARQGRSAFIGQPTTFTKRHVGRDFMLFQVVFQPGALFRLLGLPVQELNDSFEDAESVLGKQLRQVNERLSYTRHYTEMIPLVEQFLFEWVRKNPRDERPCERVARFMLTNPSFTSIDTLASQACLSPRQFYRQFTERMGISPKMFSRVVKLDHIIKLKNAQPHKDWLSLALELGYYDYQHLVRDFKEFTHLSPNGFLLAEGKSPERNFGLIEV
jgi:AraC-like DNA-binding protein